MNDITPLNFTKKSSFLFDLREKKYESLIENIDDLNTLIPDENDLLFLNNLIEEKKINKITNGELHECYILPKFKNALLAFIPGIHKLNQRMENILGIFKSIKKAEKINLKNICKKYTKITKNSISQSYVKGILNNKFNIKYLRTTTKTNKLNSKISKLRTFLFIKVIINTLRLGLNIIYVDESNFQLQNSHLKVWRNKNEYPYFKVGPKGRRNIILAISTQELLLYKINTGTNNSISFAEFMCELVKILNDKGIKDSLIIMDNCSIHLTKELTKLYKDNELKIMTIVPHLSELNGIEFFFNYIKQKIYKKVFPSFDKLISFVENILCEDYINDVINNIFTKTLNIYKDFILANKREDLNDN